MKVKVQVCVILLYIYREKTHFGMYLVPSNAFVPSFSQARANAYKRANAADVAKTRQVSSKMRIPAHSCAVLRGFGAKTPIFGVF